MFYVASTFVSQGESHRIQHAKGAEEEAKLREDLKRTQEALSFLSAWDEERIELDAEVRRGRSTTAMSTAGGYARRSSYERLARLFSVCEVANSPCLSHVKLQVAKSPYYTNFLEADFGKYCSLAYGKE